MEKILRVVVAISTVFLAGCTHTPQQALKHAAAASQKCVSQHFQTAVEEVNCNDAAETPIIKKESPVIFDAYESWNSKRRFLAKQHDNEISSAKDALTNYHQGINEAAAILIVHEPRYNDKNSALGRDFSSINLNALCHYPNSVKSAKCKDAIARPIWKRDALSTLQYYDAFNKKCLRLAHEFDKSGAGKIVAAANQRYQEGLNQAKAEFVSNIQESIAVSTPVPANSNPYNSCMLGQSLIAALCGLTKSDAANCYSNVMSNAASNCAGN